LSSKTETFKSFLQRTAIHLKDVEGQYGLNSPEYKECWLQNEAELASRPLEERIKMKGMFSWMYGTLSK
jgi:hypothetical protein